MRAGGKVAADKKGSIFGAFSGRGFGAFFVSFFDVFLRSVLGSILDPIFDLFWNRFGTQTCYKVGVQAKSVEIQVWGARKVSF